MTARFIHLHLHTEYSIIDGLIHVKPLVKAVRQAGMPACAVTDYSNLFALVKFYRAAQSAGIKPIIGVEVQLYRDEDSVSRLVLLCQNEIGYRNLTRLVSRSYTEGQTDGVPYLHQNWLTDATEGLMALSGGHEGDVGQALLAGHHHLAQQRLAEWHSLFPDRFYLELHRTGRVQEEEYLHLAVELALNTATPVVATNAVCFLTAEDFEAHEVRVCIHDGKTLADPNRPRRYTSQQYLRTPEEMAALFADIPEALENTWFIAQRCNLELTLGQNFLPDFPLPAGQTVAEYFCHQAQLGLEQRLTTSFDKTNNEAFAQQRQPYDQRLATELEVIVQMGFSGYFLIVADFIQWAKDNHIPVGPGRGSGAGSLVAYALGITDLDPLHYDLLFERFLNPERVSMPDFDIDFCMEGRDQVINYVAERYGRERVSQIITYGTMAAKAAVRDVGRVLGHPYGFVDKIAKLIPFELGITLNKALENEELRVRYEQEEEVHAVIDMARKLEGITRNPGKHAGGVVIAPSMLTDFTPLYCEADSPDLMTQFDKGDIETVGLVKFDFLGLRTLTIIKWALATVNQFIDPPLDIAPIALDDAETYELLKRGETTAVFQLESAGLKKLIRQLQPDCFEDIIALVALYRPGPLQSGMVEDFIKRKQGRAKVEYLHPDLEPILKPTYGVIVYQEQVMQIAQVLAGYTLGGADLLRRAMGKKNPQEMAKQRTVFVEGAVARQVNAELASAIFDLMEHFAGYGFNRSHSCAYALLAYQTAWLKAHYPAAFMAAVLSADMDNTDKVVTLIQECRVMKLRILPPHINRSDYPFTVEDNDNYVIRYGLGAIKGAGEAALSGIVAERAQNGQFRDLFDFCQRIDLRKASRRVLEALINAGAVDELGPSRSVLMASLETAIKLAERQATDTATGQNDLFAAPTNTPATVVEESVPFVTSVSEWSETERLNRERDSLGHYLSGHPITPYLAELTQLTHYRLAEVRATNQKQTIRIAGWVTDLRINTKRGGITFINLEDHTAQLEVKVYTELYAQVENLLALAKDSLLIIEGEVKADDYNGGHMMTAKNIFTLESARENYANRLEITITNPQTDTSLGKQLLSLLISYRHGRCAVLIHYHRAETQVDLKLGKEWRVQPQATLLKQLEELVGKDSVKVVY